MSSQEPDPPISVTPSEPTPAPDTTIGAPTEPAFEQTPAKSSVSEEPLPAPPTDPTPTESTSTLSTATTQTKKEPTQTSSSTSTPPPSSTDLFFAQTTNPSPPASNNPSSLLSGVKAGIAAGIPPLILILALVVYLLLRRRRKARLSSAQYKQPSDSSGSENENSVPVVHDTEGLPEMVPGREITANGDLPEWTGVSSAKKGGRKFEVAELFKGEGSRGGNSPETIPKRNEWRGWTS